MAMPHASCLTRGSRLTSPRLSPEVSGMALELKLLGFQSKIGENKQNSCNSYSLDAKSS